MNTDFNSCSTEELQALIKKAKKGELDLHEYWNIGDIRTVMIPKSKMSKTVTNDIRVDCSIEYIGECGRDQQLGIQAHIDELPSDLQADVRDLLPEVIKAEFGRREPLSRNLIRFEDVKWTSIENRTVPDVSKKFGIV